MAAAAEESLTGFEIMADRITEYYRIVPDQDKVRLAYIAQVLLNCLIDLAAIEGKDVSKLIRDVKGNAVINTLIENGYLNDYKVHEGDHRTPGPDEDEEDVMVQASSSSTVAKPLAAPDRSATEAGRDRASGLGEHLTSSKLTDLRSIAYHVLQDILRSVHPEEGMAYLTYDSSRSFPSESKYSISAFVGDITTIITKSDRVYARESAMVLIIHILDKMGYIGFPTVTRGVTDSILNFFKNKVFSTAVGLICVTTPHIVSYIWGIPYPTLESIYAIVSGDAGRFVIGSTVTSAYLNKSAVHDMISSAYSKVFGQVISVEPENLPEMIEVTRPLPEMPDAQKTRLKDYVTDPRISEKTRATIERHLAEGVTLTRQRMTALEGAVGTSGDLTSRYTRYTRKNNKDLKGKKHSKSKKARKKAVKKAMKSRSK